MLIFKVVTTLMLFASTTDGYVRMQSQFNAESETPKNKMGVDQINNILAHVVPKANAYIESSKILTKPIALFDLPENHLDPLNFNNKASANAEGESCLDPKCVKILGRQICTPKACAGGAAQADLQNLKGLSSLRFGPMILKDFTMDETTKTVMGHGDFSLECSDLTADAHAEASATITGIRIPVSSSGSVQAVNVKPVGNFDLKLSYTVIPGGMKVFQIESITVNNLKIEYSDLRVSIRNLGIFDGLISDITKGLKNIVSKFFNVDGALAGPLQQQLNSFLEKEKVVLNNMLKMFPQGGF